MRGSDIGKFGKQVVVGSRVFYFAIREEIGGHFLFVIRCATATNTITPTITAVGSARRAVAT